MVLGFVYKLKSLNTSKWNYLQRRHRYTIPNGPSSVLWPTLMIGVVASVVLYNIQKYSIGNIEDLPSDSDDSKKGS